MDTKDELEKWPWPISLPPILPDRECRTLGIMDTKDELEKWPWVWFHWHMFEKYKEYQLKVKQDMQTLVQHIISHIHTDLERDLDIESLSEHYPFGSLANATSRQDAIKQLSSIICRNNLQDYCFDLVRFVKTLKSTQQDHLVDKVMEAFDSLFEVKQECNTWLLDVLDILKADFRLLRQHEYRESLKESFIKNTRKSIYTASSSPFFSDYSLPKDTFLKLQNAVKGNVIDCGKNSSQEDRCKVNKLKDEIRSLLKNVTDSHITPRTVIDIYSLVTEMFTLLSDADTNNQFPLTGSHLFYNHYFSVKTEDYHSTNFVKHALKSVDWDDLEVAPVCDMLCQSGVISSRQRDSMMEEPRSARRKLTQTIVSNPHFLTDLVQVLKADTVRQDYVADKIISACDEYFEIHTNACKGNCNWLIKVCLHQNSSLKEILLSSIKETVAPCDKSARDIYFKLKDSNSPENRIKPLLESVQSGNDTWLEGVYKETDGLTKKRLNEIKYLLKEEPTPRTMRHLYQTIEMYFEELEDIQRLPSLLQKCGNLKVSRCKNSRTLKHKNVVNDFTQCVLQPMWCKLVKDIDIEPVADYLYQNRQISLYELNELTGGGNRDARARELLNIVGERPVSLGTFVQALKQISVEPKQSEEVRRIHSQLVKEILQVCDGYFMIDFEKHDEVVEELRTERFVSQPESKQQVLDEIKETVLPDESTVRDIYFEMEDSTAPENLATPLLREVKSSVRNKRDVNAEELKKEMNNMKEKRKNEIEDLRQETPMPQKMRHLYQLVKMYFEECETIEEIGEIVDREVRRNTEDTQIFGETEVKQLFHPTDEEDNRFEDTEVKQLAAETEVKETLDTTQVKQVDMEETAVKYV